MPPRSTRAEETATTPLQRPPIRQSTLVRSNVAHTFTTFVRTISLWWPVQLLSAGHQMVRAVTVEERRGGRVYETWADGTVVVWGEVRAWEPPTRFVMTWLRTPVPTEVEFTFRALGPALTRVTVEHRNWEALSDEQMQNACPLPGGYSSGWQHILACFTAAGREENVMSKSI